MPDFAVQCDYRTKKLFYILNNLLPFCIVIIVKGPFKHGGEAMTEKEFTNCVERSNQRLFLIALSFTKSKDDAEDILQNILLKLWNHKKPFENDEHMDKWLTVLCVNESKNHLKSPFRKKSTPLNEYKELYTFDEDFSYDLFNAVMSLPKDERIAIHLFYYEDMPIKEISEILKIKENAVKARLYRARQNIKKILGDDWINDK